MKAFTMEELLATESDLNDAIAAVLGFRVQVYLTERKNKTSTERKVDVTSAPLDRPGLLGFMFSDLHIGSFGPVWLLTQEQIDRDEKEVGVAVAAQFELHVSYRNQDGGTNGSALGVCGRRIWMRLQRNPDFFVRKVPAMKWMAVIS